jgi:hypothetical protein
VLTFSLPIFHHSFMRSHTRSSRRQDERGHVDAARREGLLHKRYVEPQLAAKHRSDQETWEDQQASAASLHFGARDKSGGAGPIKRRVERVRKVGPDGRLHEVEVVVEEEDLSQRKYDLVYAGTLV